MITVIYALALALNGPAPIECKLKDATFVDRAGAGYTLQFASGETPLRATVTSQSTGAVYRFTVSQGEGNSAAHFEAIPSAGVEMPAYAMEEDLSVRAQFPREAEAAPHYIFVPELGQTLWYAAEALGGPRLADRRESLPRTLFALSSCGQSE